MIYITVLLWIALQVVHTSPVSHDADSLDTASLDVADTSVPFDISGQGDCDANNPDSNLSRRQVCGIRWPWKKKNPPEELPDISETPATQPAGTNPENRCQRYPFQPLFLTCGGPEVLYRRGFDEGMQVGYVLNCVWGRIGRSPSLCFILIACHRIKGRGSISWVAASFHAESHSILLH